MTVHQLEPAELSELFSAPSSLILLDVRQPEEQALVTLPGSILIPMMEVQSRVEEIRELRDSCSGPLVVYCRSGKRSDSVAAWLLAQGFENVHNLRGGINAYAREVDTSLSPY